MPRPIKKRITKQEPAAQDEVLDFLGRIRESAATRQRQVVTALAGLVAILIVGLVIFFYQSSSAGKAQKLEAEGYQAYTGQYEYEKMLDQERLQKALELFTQAYEARKSPFALMYLVNTHYALGDYQSTIETADQMVSEFPGEMAFVPLALMKKAGALMATGQKEPALEAFNNISASAGTPMADVALFEAAKILEDLGREDEAMTKYEALSQNYPGSPYYQQAMQKLGVDIRPGGVEATGEGSPEGALQQTITPGEGQAEPAAK